MAYGYAAQNVNPEITSKAAGREIPVKPKHGINIARAIKGMPVGKAKAYLEAVINLERSIPFVTHKRQVKHRRDISGPGQYPVAATRAFLRVLNDAAANAEYKGLDPDSMIVWHACCHRGSPLPGHMPRAQGRATQWDKQTSHIEIVLSEREAKKAAPAAPTASAEAAEKKAKSKAARAGERARAKKAKATTAKAKKPAATKKTKKKEE